MADWGHLNFSAAVPSATNADLSVVGVGGVVVSVNFKEGKCQSQKRVSNFFSFFLAWSFFVWTTYYHTKDLVESL